MNAGRAKLERARQNALDDEERAVKEAPHHERPARAVPEAAEEHRDDQVRQRARGARAVSAERECRDSRATTTTT